MKQFSLRAVYQIAAPCNEYILHITKTQATCNPSCPLLNHNWHLHCGLWWRLPFEPETPNVCSRNMIMLTRAGPFCSFATVDRVPAYIKLGLREWPLSPHTSMAPHKKDISSALADKALVFAKCRRISVATCTSLASSQIRTKSSDLYTFGLLAEYRRSFEYRHHMSLVHLSACLNPTENFAGRSFCR